MQKQQIYRTVTIPKKNGDKAEHIRADPHPQTEIETAGESTAMAH